LIDCLDSWAVLRWLEGVDPAAGRVDLAFESRPVMSWINLGEVFYVLCRQVGEQEAQFVVRDLTGQCQLDLPTSARVLEAARVKAAHRLAYADAFAVATSIAWGGTLLTGDPEILNGDPTWSTLDLR
jgi:predicted nucleic acid-binding protein